MEQLRIVENEPVVLEEQGETIDTAENGEDEKEEEELWWNSKFDDLASQLPKSILMEMKDRILGSKIQKQKLELNDDSQHMADFFVKEVERYKKKLSKPDDLKLKAETEIKEITEEHNTVMTRLANELAGLKEIILQQQRQRSRFEEEKLKLYSKIKEQQALVRKVMEKVKLAEDFLKFLMGFEQGVEMINTFKRIKWG